MGYEQSDLERKCYDSLEDLCTGILTLTEGCAPQTLRFSVGLEPLLANTLAAVGVRATLERCLQANNELLRVIFAYVYAYDYLGNERVVRVCSIGIRIMSPLELLIGL